MAPTPSVVVGDCTLKPRKTRAPVASNTIPADGAELPVTLMASTTTPPVVCTTTQDLGPDEIPKVLLPNIAVPLEPTPVVTTYELDTAIAEQLSGEEGLLIVPGWPPE